MYILDLDITLSLATPVLCDIISKCFYATELTTGKTKLLALKELWNIYLKFCPMFTLLNVLLCNVL